MMCVVGQVNVDRGGRKICDACRYHVHVGKEGDIVGHLMAYIAIRVALCDTTFIRGHSLKPSPA